MLNNRSKRHFPDPFVIALAPSSARCYDSFGNLSVMFVMTM